MKTVRVFTLEREFKIFEGKIRDSAKRALKILNKENSAVEIYLIGNAQMKFLNKKFRGKNQPTNILSFEEPKDFPHPELTRRTTRTKRGPTRKLTPLGEIYLNLEQTADYRLRTTAKNKKAADRRLWSVDPLLVHGLLHLLGFRHRKKRDRIKMEETEQKILARL